MNKFLIFESEEENISLLRKSLFHLTKGITTTHLIETLIRHHLHSVKKEENILSVISAKAFSKSQSSSPENITYIKSKEFLLSKYVIINYLNRNNNWNFIIIQDLDQILSNEFLNDYLFSKNHKSSHEKSFYLYFLLDKKDNQDVNYFNDFLEQFLLFLRNYLKIKFNIESLDQIFSKDFNLEDITNDLCQVYISLLKYCFYNENLLADDRIRNILTSIIKNNNCLNELQGLFSNFEGMSKEILLTNIKKVAEIRSRSLAYSKPKRVLFESGSIIKKKLSLSAKKVYDLSKRLSNDNVSNQDKSIKTIQSTKQSKGSIFMMKKMLLKKQVPKDNEKQLLKDTNKQAPKANEKTLTTRNVQPKSRIQNLIKSQLVKKEPIEALHRIINDKNDEIDIKDKLITEGNINIMNEKAKPKPKSRLQNLITSQLIKKEPISALQKGGTEVQVNSAHQQVQTKIYRRLSNESEIFKNNAPKLSLDSVTRNEYQVCLTEVDQLSQKSNIKHSGMMYSTENKHSTIEKLLIQASKAAEDTKLYRHNSMKTEENCDFRVTEIRRNETPLDIEEDNLKFEGENELIKVRNSKFIKNPASIRELLMESSADYAHFATEPSLPINLKSDCSLNEFNTNNTKKERKMMNENSIKNIKEIFENDEINERNNQENNDCTSCTNVKCIVF